MENWSNILDDKLKRGVREKGSISLRTDSGIIFRMWSSKGRTLEKTISLIFRNDEFEELMHPRGDIYLAGYLIN